MREYEGMADNGLIVAIFNACSDALEEVPIDEFEEKVVARATADLQNTPEGKAWMRIAYAVEDVLFNRRQSPKSFLLHMDDILGDYSLEYATAWVNGEL